MIIQIQFMKSTSKLFLLPFLPVLMISLVTLTCFGSELDSKLGNDTATVANFSNTNQIDLESKRGTDNPS